MLSGTPHVNGVVADVSGVDVSARRAIRPLRAVARTSLRRTCHHYPGWYNSRDARSLQRQRRRGVVHEPDLLGAQRLVPADGLVLDVGANYGQSIVTFKAMRPDARIVSFEPNPSALVELRGLAATYAGVEVHPVAVGAEPGSIELVVPVVRGVVFHQLASLRPMETSALVAQLHADGFRWARPVDVQWRSTPIDVLPLDAFGLVPDLVKIDVEGGEVGVLDGAHETLGRVPTVVVERGLRPEVRSRLEPLGYRAMEWWGGQFHRASGRTLNTYFVVPGSPRSPLP